MDIFEISTIAIRISGLTQPLRERTSILKKKFREEKDRSEWALLDSKGKRVLRWFGEAKPSKKRVLKEEKRIQYFKHKGGSTTGITYKSAPEYKSVLDFVQFMIDDEREEFDHNDLTALNYRLEKPVGEIKQELESYGLKLKGRPIEKKPRGFKSPDLNRYQGFS